MAQPRKYKESLDEFNKEFGIIDLEDEAGKAEEAKRLKQAEDEANEQNEKFEKGEATFGEKIYPFSDLPEEQFEKEKEGLIIPPQAEQNDV